MKQLAVMGWFCVVAMLALAPQAAAAGSDAADKARLIPIEPVRRFVLSPDRKSMLYWGGGQARLIDCRTQAVKLHVEASSSWEFSALYFYGAQFSKDGSRAVLWTHEGYITLLQLDPPRVLWQEDHTQPGSSFNIRFDAELRRAAKHLRKEIRVLDLLETGPVDAVPPISAIGNEPPGFRAFSLSENGERLLFQARRGVECIELHEPGEAAPAPPVELHASESVQLFGDSDLAIVLSRDGAFLVDVRSGEIRANQPLPTGRWLTRHDSAAIPVLPIWGWPGGLRVLDVETLDVLWEADTCDVAIYDAASDVVVVMQDYSGPVSFHEPRTGEELWRLGQGEVDTYSGGLDRRATIFDGAGNFMAQSYDDSTVYSFDCRTGAREVLPHPLHGTVAHHGQLTDDVIWVADSGGELRSLSAQDGTEVASVALDEALASVESIGTTLVASTVSGRTRVWRGPELEAVTEFDGGREFALAPGADRILGCGGELQGWVAWSIHTGEVVATGGEAKGTLVDVACDADGRVVVALDEARNARVWVDGESRSLEGLLSPVEEMVVDPRGRWLALGAFGNEGPGMLPLITVYDLKEPGPPRQLKIEGSFVWFGGHIRSLAVDRNAEFLFATTGKWGTVQCWKTSDWSHNWIYDFEGGSPAPLQLKLDEANGRLWVWGLSWYAPRALDLHTGKTVQDYGLTRLSDFSPIGEQRGVVAILEGCLVRLDHDGNELWRRIDLGPLGAVVSSAAGAVRGDSAALEHVFVRVDGRVVRASEVTEDQ